MYTLLPLLIVTAVSAYQQVSFYKNITLEDLDNRLVDMIKSPKKDPDVGTNLMDGSFWYYSQLEDMEKAYVNKEPNSLNVIINLLKRGLPKFVSTKYNKTEFKTQFLWDKGDFLEFGVNVEGTTWLWDKFEEILKKENITLTS